MGSYYGECGHSIVVFRACASEIPDSERRVEGRKLYATC
jgi:hypothetical protein